MDHLDINQLFEYDGWAMNRALQAISALTPEQFTRDLNGSFRSVRDTLVHIIRGEWTWLQFWKGIMPPEQYRALSEELFEPGRFPNSDAVKSKWTQIETEQVEFAQTLTDESLQRPAVWKRGAIVLELPLVAYMQHVVNHSTYHRGQVTLMLRQLGAEPLPTDFHLFLSLHAG